MDGFEPDSFASPATCERSAAQCCPHSAERCNLVVGPAMAAVNGADWIGGGLGPHSVQPDRSWDA